ncbi:hypothetical protein FB45DRAFT_897846 [Roridomyces roridus]|uniref:Uncharacterized protein n=1 Tax=Roridomyces roridus TaxID=1738132 RepID=A0AAD7CBF0_9AGAR|nr:hypothetical protein FB45DRAFT_897846 [Roridomyces roridus]
MDISKSIGIDTFFQVLTHIHDAKTIHNLLQALTPAHPLSPVALLRLSHLPIYIDSYNTKSANASIAVLKGLLHSRSFPVESIRHIVVAVEHEPTSTPGFVDGRHVPRRPGGPKDPQAMLAIQDLLAKLVQRTRNLQSFDYHSFPGYALKEEHFRALQSFPNLKRIAVDCALRSRDVEIPASGGGYALPGALSSEYDADNWSIDMLTSTVGPTISSLELRHVNHTMLNSLKEHSSEFSSYDALEDLKIDITEGVWDWQGGGSPAMGPSPDFDFPCLGFPSVKRFELVVSDKTLQQSQLGPLNLINCNSLTELVIDCRYSLWWADWWSTVKLFEALSPSDLPALAHLEIRDRTRNTERHCWNSKDNHLGWKHAGRSYPGLVTSFLGSTSAGLLPRLTSLWVDEKVLLPSGVSAHDALLGSPGSPSETKLWHDALHTTFWQLGSLRFGLEWNWREYGPQDPISPELLLSLSRFPELVDVHILFPRPQTELKGDSDPEIDALTLEDVASIFRCNGRICRVGIGNSVVWERDPSGGPSAILLASDGSIASNPAVPRFFHAGYLAKPGGNDADADPSNTAVPPRPDRGDEIQLMQDLLQRII